MQNRFARFIARGLLVALFALVVLAIAGPVLGQPTAATPGDLTLAEDVTAAVADVVVPPGEEPPGVIEQLILTWLPRLVMGCAALTAFFPSTNKVMKIIDLFAFSWGKARNDPNAQKWAKA